eukprot:564400-Amorphochlora_amoeboformis.AAC.1
MLKFAVGRRDFPAHLGPRAMDSKAIVLGNEPNRSHGLGLGLRLGLGLGLGLGYGEGNSLE